jgi:hypothetical protein
MREGTAQLEKARDIGYQSCRYNAEAALKEARAPDRYETYSKADGACWEERFPNPDPARQGWSHWREYALGTLIACAMIYGIIWTITSVCRWVWAGRKNTVPQK